MVAKRVTGDENSSPRYLTDEFGLPITSSNPLPVDSSSGGGSSSSGRTTDSFGRLPVSLPNIKFQSKLIFDNQPKFWDEAEVSGSGTSSTYTKLRASVDMTVAANTAGKRVRQTFMRFNYNASEGRFAVVTSIINKSGGGAGIIKGFGVGDDNNGVFFVQDNGTYQWRIDNQVPGATSPRTVDQGDWSEDNLDGTGPSGLTYDPSKFNIVWFAYGWLGGTDCACGFVLGQKLILCHVFPNANSIDSVFLSTPNLPMRYFIENDGTGVESSIECICGAVVSEGFDNDTGQLKYISTHTTNISAASANTQYAILGIRLKSDFIGEQIDIANVSIINTANDDFEWFLAFNKTVSGTFTYSDKTGSALQVAVGSGASNTVTVDTTLDDDIVDGGVIKAGGDTGGIDKAIENARRLGSAIDGTPDELILCFRPFTNGANVRASITVREATG